MHMSSKQTAVLMMCGSACLIPVVDTIAKALTEVASPFFLVAARYAIGATLAALVFRSPGRAFRSVASAPVLHFGRSGLFVAAMVNFYWAISSLPVATALGGYFTGPVIAAGLSIILLGERVRASTLLAVLLGFLGALFILHPENSITFGSLFALLSGVLSGFYLVLTRAASLFVRAEDNVLIQSVIGAALIAPIAVVNVPAINLTIFFLILLMGVLSFAAHGLFLAAFRILDVGTLAPLAYLEIAIAALLGWAIFGDLPSILAWVGIACVVTAGLLIALSPASSQQMAEKKSVQSR